MVIPMPTHCGPRTLDVFSLLVQVASTRWGIQDEQRVQNTPCDNCLISECQRMPAGQQPSAMACGGAMAQDAFT